MKKFAFTTIVLAAACLSTGALAQQKSDDMKGMTKTPSTNAPMARSHTASGVVKKVDSKAGLVTLEHGPVKTLNWPAMTMGFSVKDPMLLDKLAPGKKVKIEFTQDSGGYVITSVK